MRAILLEDSPCCSHSGVSGMSVRSFVSLQLQQLSPSGIAAVGHVGALFCWGRESPPSCRVEWHFVSLIVAPGGGANHFQWPRTEPTWGSQWSRAASIFATNAIGCARSPHNMWAVFQQDGPNHLGLWENTIALINSGGGIKRWPLSPGVVVVMRLP